MLRVTMSFANDLQPVIVAEDGEAQKGKALVEAITQFLAKHPTFPDAKMLTTVQAEAIECQKRLKLCGEERRKKHIAEKCGGFCQCQEIDVSKSHRSLAFAFYYNSDLWRQVKPISKYMVTYLVGKYGLPEDKELSIKMEARLQRIPGIKEVIDPRQVPNMRTGSYLYHEIYSEYEENKPQKSKLLKAQEGTSKYIQAEKLRLVESQTPTVWLDDMEKALLPHFEATKAQEIAAYEEKLKAFHALLDKKRAAAVEAARIKAEKPDVEPPRKKSTYRSPESEEDDIWGFRSYGE